MNLRTTTLSAVMALALTTIALAHSKSEVTVPADGSIVEAAPAIEIRFDKPMRVTAVKLLHDGSELEIERATGMAPVTEFQAVPASMLVPGAYTVEWRSLSDDGHPMQGSFGFTVSE